MRIYDKSEDISDIEKRWKLIDFCASDPSSALRLGAIHRLTYMIIFDRTRAVRIFEQLVGEHRHLLAFSYVAEFIYWALYKNIKILLPYILEMLNDDQEDAQESGARLITIASISPNVGETKIDGLRTKILARKIRRGKKSWKKAATKVYSANLSTDCRKTCQAALIRLLRREAELCTEFSLRFLTL